MLDKIRSYYRNLSKKNKVVMPLMLVVFVVLFFIGISMVYAFYHNSLSFSIIAIGIAIAKVITYMMG